jgi:hypothetical protein
VAVEVELEVTDIEAATRRSPILRAADVFGPQERIVGARDHVFRRTRSGVLLNAQHFKVDEPFVYRIIRRHHLTLILWRRAATGR